MTRGDEYRCIARDCVAMGRPDLALSALQCARQADEEDRAKSFGEFVMRARAADGAPSETGEA